MQQPQNELKVKPKRKPRYTFDRMTNSPWSTGDVLRRANWHTLCCSADSKSNCFYPPLRHRRSEEAVVSGTVSLSKLYNFELDPLSYCIRQTAGTYTNLRTYMCVSLSQSVEPSIACGAIYWLRHWEIAASAKMHVYESVSSWETGSRQLTILTLESCSPAINRK